MPDSTSSMRKFHHVIRSHGSELFMRYAADKALYPKGPWIRVVAHCCGIGSSLKHCTYEWCSHQPHAARPGQPCLSPAVYCAEPGERAVQPRALPEAVPLRLLLLQQRAQQDQPAEGWQRALQLSVSGLLLSHQLAQMRPLRVRHWPCCRLACSHLFWPSPRELQH